jgi:hypothetical protein
VAPFHGPGLVGSRRQGREDKDQRTGTDAAPALVKMGTTGPGHAAPVIIEIGTSAEFARPRNSDHGHQLSACGLPKRVRQKKE